MSADTAKASGEDAANDRGVRISLPGPEDMSPAQKKVYDDMVNGPRGRMIGPIRAVIHSPELADRWQRLGEYVRYRTILPEALTELAIVASARHWNSNLEWGIHSRIAEAAGVDAEILRAIREGEAPVFSDAAYREVYEFARELLMHGQVKDATYLAIKSRWGEKGVVELTAVVGYYSMVAMMLNAHHVPMPPGMDPAFDADESDALPDLSELPSS